MKTSSSPNKLSKVATSNQVESQSEQGFASKFARYLPLVMAADAPTVLHFANDPQVVLTNVNIAVRNLTPHADTLRADTTVDWVKVFELSDLAEAFVYATTQAPTADGATRDEIESKRVALQKLREPALYIARGLALLGNAPLHEVEAIEAGRGLIDAGRDGIALAAFFHNHASAIANQHPFTPKMLTDMSTLGEWIIRNVRPDGAHERATTNASNTPSASEQVDRFWTEIVKRHTWAEQAAFKLWNKNYGQYVPPLLSRPSVARPATDPTPAVEPPATPEAPAKPTT